MMPDYYALQQCDKVTLETYSMPYMKSLHSCQNRIVGDGYTDEFVATQDGLQSKTTKKLYSPRDIRIVNFFRFEGNSNPADNVIMYIIETADGLKGTLVSSYGTLLENRIGSLFMMEGENLQ